MRLFVALFLCPLLLLFVLPDSEALRSQTAVEEYCSEFKANYLFYCSDSRFNNLAGDIGRTISFCWTYDNKCMRKKRLESATIFLPFHEPWLVHSKADEETSRLLWAKVVPCTESCNAAIYPHCTQECKCDYNYPAVQRFCNPPPIPLFLNTCRLWYYKCPKYEQYHYASQFIYSKAEKGKVLPGRVVNPNPFGIASQASFYSPAA